MGMETVHWAIKSYVCEYEGCGKQFGQKGHLTRHKETHSQDNKYKCPFDCPYTTNHNSVLVRHIKKDHKMEALIDRSFPCEYEGCGKKFGQKGHLTRHVDTVHLEVKSFVCNHEGCGKQFGQKGHLTRHEGIHSEVKKYKCPYDNCSYATSDRSTFVRHTKNKHTIEEVIDRACDSQLLPFVCEEEGCIERFATEEDCSFHRETIH